MSKTIAYGFAFARKRSIEALALMYIGPGGLVTAVYEHSFKTKPMSDFRQCRDFAEAEAWFKSKAGTMTRLDRPLGAEDVRQIARQQWSRGFQARVSAMKTVLSRAPVSDCPTPKTNGRLIPPSRTPRRSGPMRGKC